MRLICVALICAGLFGWLSWPVAWGAAIPGDVELLNRALSLRDPTLTLLMQLLAFISSAVPAAVICSGVTLIEIWRAGRFHPGTLWALLALAGSTLSNISLRVVIGRLPPPVETIGNLLPEIQASFHRYSYPSGHAGAAVVAYLALVVLFWSNTRSRPWVTALSGVVILSAGFGRCYLGVHWPSDVLGGYLLALTWWAVGMLVRQRYNA